MDKSIKDQAKLKPFKGIIDALEVGDQFPKLFLPIKGILAGTELVITTSDVCSIISVATGIWTVETMNSIYIFRNKVFC